MSESPQARSLRAPGALAVGLLVTGVAGLVVRAEVLQWGWYWDLYRRDVVQHAQWLAKMAARHVTVSAQNSAPLPRPVLTAQFALAQAMPALTVLVIGVMVMLLVAHGRRVAWVAVAVGACLVNDPSTVIDGYGGWTNTAGHAVGIALIAAAVTPLLIATRNTARSPHPIPRPVIATAAAVAGLGAALVYVGPPNADVPRPAAAAALLLYGALIASGSLPRRWLPAALALPALALPGTGWALGDTAPGSEAGAAYIVLGLLAYFAGVAAVRPPRRWLPVVLAIPFAAVPQYLGVFNSTGDPYDPSTPTFLGPLVVALAVVGFGAAVALYGTRLQGAWVNAVRRGPLLAGQPAEAVSA